MNFDEENFSEYKNAFVFNSAKTERKSTLTGAIDDDPKESAAVVPQSEQEIWRNIEIRMMKVEKGISIQVLMEILYYLYQTIYDSDS